MKEKIKTITQSGNLNYQTKRILQGKPLSLLALIFLMTIYCLSVIIPLSAQDQSKVLPKIEQNIIRPPELYIGTPFYLNVEITTATDQEVYHPVKDSVDVFVITDIRKKSSRQNELLLTRISYKMTSFDTGDLILPPLNFEIFDPVENQITTLRSSPVELQFHTILADTSQVLKDISGPFKLRLELWDYLIPLLALLVLTLLLVFIWKKIKQREIIPLPVEEKDTRSPYQIALELLDSLKKKRLIEQGNYLEYYFQLSYILRFFLELHYKFNAVEMTSSEIGYEIRDFDQQERTELEKFLRDTDQVKFAKFVPFVNDALEQTKWLESYLKSFVSRESKTAVSNEEQ